MLRVWSRPELNVERLVPNIDGAIGARRECPTTDVKRTICQRLSPCQAVALSDSRFPVLCEKTWTEMTLASLFLFGRERLRRRFILVSCSSPEGTFLYQGKGWSWRERSDRRATLGHGKHHRQTPQGYAPKQLGPPRTGLLGCVGRLPRVTPMLANLALAAPRARRGLCLRHVADHNKNRSS